jgi:crotonobetainyl-CoA:carnitine CoA-transferase CaiB-like acyl-CoA transferase
MTTELAGVQQTQLLRGLTAVNAGSGFVAAIASKLLADLGVTVRRALTADRDPAEEIYPAYKSLCSHERVERRIELTASGLEPLLTSTDICIVGGECLPGAVKADTLASELAAAHPELIVLDIRGYPAGSACESRPAVDILVQARSGLVYEHYSNRPNLMSFQPSQYGAALQGVMGVLAAAIARERDCSPNHKGSGQIVSTSLHEGALMWVTTWNEAERPDIGFKFVVPLDPRPLILECSDGTYVQIILGAINSKYALYQVLGIADPEVKPGDSGVPDRNNPPEKFYGDLELLGPYIARWRSPDLVAALSKAGVAAMPVLEPGAAWDDPQVRHNGLVKKLPDGSEIVGSPFICCTPGPATVPQEPRASVDSMPLAGLRAIDFGAFTAGPLVQLFLRKLGADVIKVEPLVGDPARNMPRAFMASNRGKRSIAVDMKTPRGRELVQRLCASADFVASNFRPGVAGKLGIDGRMLLEKYPRLIVLEAPAFGGTGPRASETAFDLVLQAFCGFEMRAGGIGNKPLWNRTFLADYGGGQLGAIAMLAGLNYRQRTGHGALLEVSLLSGAFFLQSEIVRRPDKSFVGAPLLNADQTGFHPAECLYRTRDAWIAVAIRDDTAAHRLCDVLKIRHIEPTMWRTWGESAGNAIQAAVESRDADEVLSAFGESATWAEKCVSGMEHLTLTDPQLQKLGIIEHALHPQYGLVSQMGSLFRLSRSALAPPGPAPLLGEHSVQILRDLGYVESEVEAMQRDKVVK